MRYPHGAKSELLVREPWGCKKPTPEPALSPSMKTPGSVRGLRQTYSRLHSQGHVDNKAAILVRAVLFPIANSGVTLNDGHQEAVEACWLYYRWFYAIVVGKPLIAHWNPSGNITSIQILLSFDASETVNSSGIGHRAAGMVVVVSNSGSPSAFGAFSVLTTKLNFFANNTVNACCRPAESLECMVP
ncbi:uncharacterized protein K441DRAFT_651464 [Cenococcum geophilum 1.58]|uniref:uncharacterized protein n=1 Tax=Cenococcum geophilum 1.58 TaxID=794803 RepID=UPI00358EEAC1|nr:hypothetical protein K441DRAFT_651464 [Cenococcum geophilum 1.58]